LRVHGVKPQFYQASKLRHEVIRHREGDRWHD
jgi:hypothetical protein